MFFVYAYEILNVAAKQLMLTDVSLQIFKRLDYNAIAYCHLTANYLGNIVIVL